MSVNSDLEVRKTLLVTRSYPSNEDLYRYPFVHRRVVGYQQRGVEVDVFRIGGDVDGGSYVFNGVECHTGSLRTLVQWLDEGDYKQVAVHGLSEKIWPSIERFVDRMKIYGWLHGSEIHAFHRNALLDDQREAEQAFQRTLAFWRSLLNRKLENLKLVFVSNFAADEAMGNLGFSLNTDQYDVIPNPIDTELFNYVRKPVIQRLRMLSIRPYDTARYANDLMVKIILELSLRQQFDQMHFHIIGDGPLFAETLAPLAGMSNVKIERKFVRQDEIASLHKESGVFLVPTRMDTHGVSRDEAMSSGLVPVTNAVSAIPEYADEGCAILSDGEDYLSLADGISDLAANPARFEVMSAAAAAKVRRTTTSDLIIPRELRLLGCI